VGAIANASAKAAAMVKTLPAVVHLLFFMRNLPFCLSNQAANPAHLPAIRNSVFAGYSVCGLRRRIVPTNSGPDAELPSM
jgi:hypothetical protein